MTAVSRTPLVTCLFNPWPHALDDECQNLTYRPGRARFCDRAGPHDWHEWYDPALRWECPGRPADGRDPR
jgi:hypothetical protein